jgi:hypothetical protein
MEDAALFQRVILSGRRMRRRRLRGNNGTQRHQAEGRLVRMVEVQKSPFKGASW